MDTQEPQIISVVSHKNTANYHVLLLLIPAIIFVAVLAFFSLQIKSEPQVLSVESQSTQ